MRQPAELAVLGQGCGGEDVDKGLGGGEVSSTVSRAGRRLRPAGGQCLWPLSELGAPPSPLSSHSCLSLLAPQSGSSSPPMRLGS